MKRIKIGTVGVDSGLVWIGDPCYILHTDTKDAEKLHNRIGRSWVEFCDKLSGIKHTSFKYLSRDREGLGMAVYTPYGDGEYPVYAEVDEGENILKITIDLAQDEDALFPEED